MFYIVRDGDFQLFNTFISTRTKCLGNARSRDIKKAIKWSKKYQLLFIESLWLIESLLGLEIKITDLDQRLGSIHHSEYQKFYENSVLFLFWSFEVILVIFRWNFHEAITGDRDSLETVSNVLILVVANGLRNPKHHTFPVEYPATATNQLPQKSRFNLNHSS